MATVGWIDTDTVEAEVKRLFIPEYIDYLVELGIGIDQRDSTTLMPVLGQGSTVPVEFTGHEILVLAVAMNKSCQISAGRILAIHNRLVLFDH